MFLQGSLDTPGAEIFLKGMLPKPAFCKTAENEKDMCLIDAKLL